MDFSCSSQIEPCEFEKLVQFSPHGLQMIDMQGTILYANEACHRIYGYLPGKLIGMKVQDLPVAEENRRESVARLERLFRKQILPEPYGEELCKKDGKSIWGKINWDYRRNSDGIIVGFFAAITDITEQKRLDESSRKIRKRYQVLFDGIPQPVLICDRTSNVLLMNDCGASNLGLSPKECTGKKLREILPTISESALRKIAHVIDTGESVETIESVMILGQEKTYISTIRPSHEIDEQKNSFDYRS